MHLAVRAAYDGSVVNKTIDVGRKGNRRKAVETVEKRAEGFGRPWPRLYHGEVVQHCCQQADFGKHGEIGEDGIETAGNAKRARRGKVQGRHIPSI
jgi:hypothetical protein